MRWINELTGNAYKYLKIRSFYHNHNNLQLLAVTTSTIHQCNTLDKHTSLNILSFD